MLPLASHSTGKRIDAVTPRGAPAVSVILARAPYSALSRERVFAKPTPAPVLPENPAPLSRTSTNKSSPSRRAWMSIRPPSGSGDNPCLIAFSTSVGSTIGGTRALARRGIMIDRKVQPFAHSHLQDRQERACQLELASKRRARLAHRRQRGAQIVDQAGQHFAPLVGCRFVQSLYVGQRVEQKVRLDLRLQRRQLRFAHLRLQRLLPAFGIGEAAACLLVCTHGSEKPIGQDRRCAVHKANVEMKEAADIRSSRWTIGNPATTSRAGTLNVAATAEVRTPSASARRGERPLAAANASVSAIASSNNSPLISVCRTCSRKVK